MKAITEDTPSDFMHIGDYAHIAYPIDSDAVHDLIEQEDKVVLMYSKEGCSLCEHVADDLRQDYARFVTKELDRRDITLVLMNSDDPHYEQTWNEHAVLAREEKHRALFGPLMVCYKDHHVSRIEDQIYTQKLVDIVKEEYPAPKVAGRVMGFLSRYLPW